jgi:hypothetical protein
MAKKQNPSQSSNPYPHWDSAKVRERGTETHKQEHESSIRKIDEQNERKMD